MTTRAIDRNDFARAVALVLTISTRAIDQALDPAKPDLSEDDVRNYTDAIRDVLIAMEDPKREPMVRP